MTHQRHQRLIDGASQVENFDKIVGASGRYKVLIFVEIDAQNSIIVGSYPLDVLAASQIPDPTSLVVRAAGEDALVSWVPDGLVDGLVVLESIHSPILRRTCIPQPNRGVHGSAEDHSLVDVVPFAIWW